MSERIVLAVNGRKEESKAPGFEEFATILDLLAT